MRNSKVCKQDFSCTSTIQYSECTLFAEWKLVAIVCTIHHHVLQDTTGKSTLYVYRTRYMKWKAIMLHILNYCWSNTWRCRTPLPLALFLFVQFISNEDVLCYKNNPSKDLFIHTFTIWIMCCKKAVKSSHWFVGLQDLYQHTDQLLLLKSDNNNDFLCWSLETILNI